MMFLGLICGLISMFGWGIADFLMKEPGQKIGSFRTLFFIQVINLILTIPFFFYYLIKYSFNIGLMDLVLLFLIGILDLFAYLNFLEGITKGELAIVSPIVSVYSIITVVLSVIILGEFITNLQMVAIILALIGVVLTSVDLKNLHNIHSVKGLKNAFFAMLGWGIFLFLTGFLESRIHWIQIFLLSNLIIAGVIIFFLLFKIKTKKIPKSQMSILTVIAIISSLSWISMNIGFSVSSVSIVSVVSSLSPFITVILAVIYLKEKLILNQKIGIFLIISSLVLISL
jgi:drug/metabolite transporter (DMT)-like permease